jgi:hypothetical protein
MTTVATSYGDTTTADDRRQSLVRRVITGAAPFDGVMGIACLAAAAQFGDWLSVGAGAIRATGVVFLAAAVAGVWTLRRPSLDVRAIVAANAVFAVWCLVVLATDGPNSFGEALLIVSAVASGGTAVAEHRLAAQR